MRKSYGKRADGTEMTAQWQVILYYLTEHPGEKITSWWAIREFGFTRLSGVVKQIEERTGIVLARRRREVITRYGAKTFVTEYWLRG